MARSRPALWSHFCGLGLNQDRSALWDSTEAMVRDVVLGSSTAERRELLAFLEAGLATAQGFRDLRAALVEGGAACVMNTRYLRPEMEAIAHEVAATLDKRFEVWRLDDNGNEFPVTAGGTEAEAEQIRAMYEARGHKQTYTVREREDAQTD